MPAAGIVGLLIERGHELSPVDQKHLARVLAAELSVETLATLKALFAPTGTGPPDVD